MANNWDRVEELFDKLVTLAKAERGAFLDRECADDVELRAELESLLDSYEPARNFLNDANLNFEATLAGALEEYTLAGRMIGPYRVERHLGEGGAGIVLAVTDTRNGTPAAMKILAMHMAHGEHLLRFRREGQILKLLQHPEIARLLDVGATDEGQPYLVMEYVEGLRIDEYCDANHLTVEQRLRLFLRVCATMQAAHESLVAHLDLKPSNILIGAGGAVKVLDFGAAKLFAVDQESTTTRPLTPAYASPEQLRGEAVTTACDVYSLGVILYELLTGASPFRQSNSLASIVERAGGDTDPRPLPEVLSVEAAARRAADVGSLRSVLRGDLESIVAKQLAGTASRRYKSPGEVADDIGRYLDGRTVLAQRQTTLYRVGKFVRRHRGSVAISALLALALLGAGGYALWQQERAVEQGQRAAAAYEFLVGLITLPAIDADARPDMTVTELLEITAKRAAPESLDNPQAAGDIMMSITRALMWKGRMAAANNLIERARLFALSTGDEPHLAALKSYQASSALIANKPEEALRLADEALVGWEKYKGRFSEPLAAELLMTVGTIKQYLRPAESQHRILLERAEGIVRSMGRRLTLALPGVLTILADSYVIEKRYGDAERVLREAIALIRPNPMLRGNLVQALQTLGRVSRFQGRFEQDEMAQYEAFELSKSMSGNGLALAPQARWAYSLTGVGRDAEAYQQATEALAALRKSGGKPTFFFWTNLATAAYTALLTDRYKESEELAREALSVLPPNPNAQDARWEETRSYLGLALLRQGKKAEARDVVLETAKFFGGSGRKSRLNDLLQAAAAEFR